MRLYFLPGGEKLYNNFENYDYDSFFPNFFETKKENSLNNNIKCNKVTDTNLTKKKN